MKPQHAFVAARALASHDPALLARGPGQAECLAALAGVTTRLARTLRVALARLCGGQPPEVTIAPPVAGPFAALNSDFASVYSRYALPACALPMLGAIEVDAVLRLVDRAFGGPGEVPRVPPRDLPPSADLMVQRIEAILAAELTAAAGLSVPVHPLGRDTDWPQVIRGDGATPALQITIRVAEPSHTPWAIYLALPQAAVPALTGLAAPARGPAPGHRHDPGDAPFAALPLTLSALLVDTTVPLHRVSRLEVGQVLNLPIARQVPLVAGSGRSQRVVASGTIGAVDDRVAIQITQTPDHPHNSEQTRQA